MIILVSPGPYVLSDFVYSFLYMLLVMASIIFSGVVIYFIDKYRHRKEKERR